MFAKGLKINERYALFYFQVVYVKSALLLPESC